MNVYLDSAVENRTPELALQAVRLETWNGIPVPVVTAAEFRRFIAAWQANDPNGGWRAEGVSEHVAQFVWGMTATLTYDDGEHDEPDMWQAVDAIDGQALYALSGWGWTE